MLPAGTVWAGPALTVTAWSMVTVQVAIFAGHPPLTLIVFVIVYVPGWLVPRFISPVLVLTKLSPAGDALKLPALAPAGKVGKGFAPSWQYGPPYVKAALVVVTIETLALPIPAQAPLPAKEIT